VDKSKIYLSPLNIKLALIKISVNIMDKESKRFAYLRQKFPKISEEEISFGTGIKQLFKDHGFSKKLNATERRTWEAFENLCKNFQGNEAENYSDIMQELTSSYSAIGCNASLKLHFLHSHLDFLLKTW
jgi:glucokinase